MGQIATSLSNHVDMKCLWSCTMNGDHSGELSTNIVTMVLYDAHNRSAYSCYPVQYLTVVSMGFPADILLLFVEIQNCNI